jgi:hypothetical protein
LRRHIDVPILMISILMTYLVPLDQWHLLFPMDSIQCCFTKIVSHGGDVRCKRPKLELLHGEDYEQGKERVENYKQIASALKKRES